MDVEEIRMGNKELLFFSKGDTCEPCKEVQRYLDDKSVSGYVKVNPFEEIELSIQHNVKTVPCLVLLEDGVEIKRVVGSKVDLNSKRFDKLIELYNKK